MGINRILSDSLNSTIDNQFKKIVQPGKFNNHTAVAPGIIDSQNTSGELSNGSVILVPDNTAAVIFGAGEIESIITETGKYIYEDGVPSVFDGDGIRQSLINSIKDRFVFRGNTADEKQIAYVNLREIDNIKYGTPSPVNYFDSKYNVAMEVVSYGSFSIRIIDPALFVTNYLPPLTISCSFDDYLYKERLYTELIQSVVRFLSFFSKQYLVTDLLSCSKEITENVLKDIHNNKKWKERFGIELINLNIENIDYSAHSKELIYKYSSEYLKNKVYEDVSDKAIDRKVREELAVNMNHSGASDVLNTLVNIKAAQSLNTLSDKKSFTPEEQITLLRRFKELLDEGILTEEEFNSKKKEIMNL